jgi:hypothetical protein
MRTAPDRPSRGAAPLKQTLVRHQESIRRETHPDSGAEVTQLTSAALIHHHVSIGPGDERPRDVARGWAFDHLAVTPDGRYFVSEVKPDARIVVGSVATGRVRVLCASGASLGRPQYTHTHPLFSPDAGRVLFNSDRTGLGQIHAATVPVGFLASLDGSPGGGD